MAKKSTYEELEQRVKELTQFESDCKQLELKLKDSDKKNRAWLENSPICTKIVDLDFNLQYMSSAGIKSLRIEDITQYYGKPYPFDFYPELFRNFTAKNLEKVRETSEIITQEGSVVDIEENELWFHSTIVPVNDEKGRIEYFIVISIDITLRKQAEEALKKSHDELEQRVDKRTQELVEANASLQNEIIEHRQAEEALQESEHYLKEAQEITKLGHWKLNPETEEVYGSDEFFRIFGLSRQKATLEAFTDVVHPDDRENDLYHIKRGMEEGIPWDIEHRLILKDGTEKTIHTKGSPSIDKTGKVIEIIGTVQDISEKKRFEAQLQQAQKMEAIGTLAGGIAHDFNNLLMGIQGRASLMLMHTASTNSHYEHLKGIEDYVESAADLTKQLLAFARGGKYEVKPTDINELIKKENRMFGRTKKEITIHGKYEKNLWTAEVDQGQIEQVLLNLYVNAWQSMPGGGDLYIQTENVTLDENYTKPFEVKPGKYVKISITDTGVGMDEATRQRIFDPFFTTKEMGRGTGLGLATVYGIIKNHEGFINVYSEKGEGTTFNIYLPASEREIIEEKELAKEVIKGTETVLLVDDENVIIYAVELLLKEMGYKTFIARSGKETLKIYKKNKDKIDVVILDMIMPDMGGGETYDKLKEINPDIKVLLSSGYSINGEAKEILERGCNGFIQKPYRSKELSQKIRKILDKG